MWLFHSVDLAALTNKEDMRFQLLDYCYGAQKRATAADDGVVQTAPPEDVLVSPFDSLFEQRICSRLVDRGYSVVPQFPALGYRLDLVVVGAKTRLAVECDGDHWHGPDAYQRDMARLPELEIHPSGWTSPTVVATGDAPEDVAEEALPGRVQILPSDTASVHGRE